MTYQAVTKSDVGRVRSKNEDAVLADEQKGLFIVADGLGGHQAGEVASQMTIQMINERFGEDPSEDPDIGQLKGAVEKANEAVYRRAHDEPDLYGMGTTVVAAAIRSEKLLLAHVGDSRAYILRDRELIRLTEDHSVVFQLFKRGMIREEDALTHPYRGLLERSLGTEATVEVDCQELGYRGETLLLCSDGLTDMLKDAEIEEILLANPDLKRAGEILVDAANANGGSDNITVLLAKAEQSRVHHFNRIHDLA